MKEEHQVLAEAEESLALAVAREQSPVLVLSGEADFPASLTRWDQWVGKTYISFHKPHTVVDTELETRATSTRWYLESILELRLLAQRDCELKISMRKLSLQLAQERNQIFFLLR